MSQILYLIKQELQISKRSRYIMISFIIMPLLMWGLQGGIQVITQGLIFSEGTAGKTLHVVNDNTAFANVTLPRPYSLPFDFNNMDEGTLVTEINLAEFFVSRLMYETLPVANNSILQGYRINTSLTKNQAIQLAESGEIDQWLEIPYDFGINYNNSNFGNITLHYLSTSLVGPINLQFGINSILAREPFTYLSIEDKFSACGTATISLQGVSDEESQFDYGVGFASLLVVLLSVMAPAPFVSSSFAGEREKKTMESLLAMPISRERILLGKLCAGMVLVSIFAIMNLVGMALFGFIMSEFTPTTNGIEEADTLLSLDLSVTAIPAITLVMFLSAFISIGIGVALASLTKDVRTSESMYSTLLMIPSLIVGMLGMFSGVPEAISNEPAVLLLYIIPWSHTLAIFHKMMRPQYYNVKALFGPNNLWMDFIFHFTALFITIAIILFIASKVFEREGIVN